MRNTLYLVIAALGGLGLVFWGVARMWADLGVHLSLHGWIAYGLGGLFSFLLSAGLFYLVFKSAREGYDTLQKTDSYEE